MNTVAGRILAAAAALALLALAAAGLVAGGGARPGPGPGPRASVAPERLLFTPAQRQTADFIERASAAAGSGQGLFATDFFKPRPAAKLAPKPPAPTTREAVVFYRGLAVFPDGSRVAYLVFEGRTLTLSAGEKLTGEWALADFDGEQAVLVKGEKKIALAFNRRAVLSVPIQP